MLVLSRIKLMPYGNALLAKMRAVLNAWVLAIISVLAVLTRALTTSFNQISRSASLTVFVTAIPTPLLEYSVTPVYPTVRTKQHSSFAANVIPTTSSTPKTHAANVLTTVTFALTLENVTPAKLATTSTREPPVHFALLKAS